MQARQVTRELASAGVAAVALSFVDNAGITRAKAVPLSRFEAAARDGVGMSPVFDVFLVDDSITSSEHVGGPAGDLRLVPDLDRTVPLGGQPGWAWAPVNRFTQDGSEYAACQRSFARRMARRAADSGLSFRMGIEVEWALGRGDAEEFVPATGGPAYGLTRLVERSEFARDLLAALARSDVEVEQFHPEYADAQFELSTVPADPVAAADLSVLVRASVRAVAAAYGLRVSFAPRVTAGTVGNGGHLHLSASADGRPLLAGGDGRYGLTGRGESMLAGLLAALPALCAIGAPGVPSYLRLVPSHWAGCYQCWGVENREAALRFIPGPGRPAAANAELKCFDLAANPYLLVGSVLAVALDAVDRGLALPAAVPGDPALLGDDDELRRRGIPRLPTTLPDAVDALAGSDLLRAALGDPLFLAVLAVRRGEAALFADAGPEEVVAATRWRY
jgi:glutamine synthetase